MTTGEIRYSARIRHPAVFERERACLTELALYRDGVLVAPTEAGSTYTLLAPDGTAVVDGEAVTVPASGVAQYTVLAAALPSTLALGQRYQERWYLVTPDGARTYRRAACLSLFRWACPVTDADLTSLYPGLLTDFSGAQTSLQDQIDNAADEFIRRLWRHARWPELIVSPSDTFEPVRELALACAYRALYRHSGGSTERHKVLWDYHERKANTAIAEMSYQEDLDHDGLVDDDGRTGSGGVISRNVAPRRRLARSGRW